MAGREWALRASGSKGWSLWLEAAPRTVSAVRRELERMGLPTGLLDDAKLLSSELVTNSIRHAGLGPTELIQVITEWSGSVLRVIVCDRAHRDRSVVAGAIRPAPGARSGWGLFLVDQIARRWGTNLRGRPCYWFELEDSPAPARASPEDGSA